MRFKEFIERTAPVVPTRQWHELQLHMAATSNRPLSDFDGWPEEDRAKIKSRRALYNEMKRAMAENPPRLVDTPIELGEDNVLREGQDEECRT